MILRLSYRDPPGSPARQVPSSSMTFFGLFLVFQTIHQVIHVSKAQILFRRVPKSVSGRPWTAKNSDFVNDILQKSTFQAIRIQDLVKTASGTLLDRVRPSNEAQVRVLREGPRTMVSAQNTVKNSGVLMIS